ncbi:TRAP transporter substrate-binding protein [Salinisphaera sp.]|uniref:TRAP transporter substrate-binding protein n=1 Tax=Salinisphaera sp. TaxID=1914330 RepID=UPI000C4C306A|nr:TRAP transporter substrate-binding protein [Salinisphaera sp.]MAS10628.1 C4-dicarboxylate ABC transporter [Salinisphaera sp.]
MTRRTSTLLCAVAALGVFAASVGVGQAAETIKFGHVGQPGSLMDKTAKEFAKRANEKLGDKAEVRVYGSSQLGSDTQMLRKLKLGTIDMSLPSTVMSSVAPSFALFEMPFLVNDREHMARIRESELISGKLDEAAASQNYKILGVWENGFRNITNNERPISSPDDLKGIKLRTPNGQWRVRMFKSYGANPTPMPYSETFVALQTGAVDGQENPLAQIYPARFYEVQKYLSLSRHVYTPAYVLAGASWQRMPEDVRSVLKETAEEMQPVALEMGTELEEELLTKLKDEGMEVNDIDRQAFVDASEPIYQQFESDVDDGEAMIEEVRSLKDE